MIKLFETGKQINTDIQEEKARKVAEETQERELQETHRLCSTLKEDKQLISEIVDCLKVPSMYESRKPPGCNKYDGKEVVKQLAVKAGRSKADSKKKWISVDIYHYAVPKIIKKAMGIPDNKPYSEPYSDRSESMSIVLEENPHYNKAYELNEHNHDIHKESVNEYKPSEEEVIEKFPEIIDALEKILKKYVDPLSKKPKHPDPDFKTNGRLIFRGDHRYYYSAYTDHLEDLLKVFNSYGEQITLKTFEKAKDLRKDFNYT